MFAVTALIQGATSVMSVPRIVLFTGERNDVAQRMFADCGFHPTMIEMTRDLSANA
jgi:hypothetical protein